MITTMCINQRQISVTKGPEFVKQVVPCGYCWACLKNRQNDIVGRAMCELHYSTGAYFLTLTYDDKRIAKYARKTGDNRDRTSVIIKKDFQDFLKRHRKGVRGNVLNVRYVATAEFGSKKSRVHFHAILYYSGLTPDITLYKNVHIKSWPWGHVYAKPVTIDSIRYVAKYLTKSRDPKIAEPQSQEWFTYSKRPILGHQSIVDLAWRHAQQKILPHNFRYVPPGYTGHPKMKFNFYGASQNVFWDILEDLWPEHIDVPRGEYIENSWRRYRQHRAQQIWKAHKEKHGFQNMTRDQKIKFLDNADPLRLTKPHSAQVMSALIACENLNYGERQNKT